MNDNQYLMNDNKSSGVIINQYLMNDNKSSGVIIKVLNER